MVECKWKECYKANQVFCVLLRMSSDFFQTKQEKRRIVINRCSTVSQGLYIYLYYLATEGFSQGAICKGPNLVDDKFYQLKLSLMEAKDELRLPTLFS